MRSSRSAPDPLDPGPAGFAHRGLHYGTQFPENSLTAFAAALEVGAGIECDLRLTADNRIIVFHDADAWRLCASRMTIGTSTLAEIERLSIGGFTIPTLESLLTVVADRVPLLLEVKTERDVWRWVPSLRQALSGYDGRFGVMSFDARIPRLLKTNLPSVRRGLVSFGPGHNPIGYPFLAPGDFDFDHERFAALSACWQIELVDAIIHRVSRRE